MYGYLTDSELERRVYMEPANQTAKDELADRVRAGRYLTKDEADELDEKSEALKERIQELEDALREARDVLDSAV